MSGIKTLSNIKRMGRGVNLRDGRLSDEEMSSMMEEIMNHALVAQASGNEKMMKRSMQELRQTRKDIRNKNIDMSSNSKQSKMVGRFSRMIDQLDGEQEEKAQKSGSSFTDNLPSAETIISAVMTTNPLMGYSAKILKDLGGSIKKKKSGDRETKKKEAELIEQNMDYVLGRKDLLETEGEITDQNAKQITKYDQILERMEAELIKLRMLWEGDDSSLVRETNESNNKLSRLVEVEERILEDQRLQQEQSEFDNIETDRGGGVVVPDVGGGDNKKKGFLSKILGGLGRGIMMGVTAFMSLITAIGGIGMVLLGGLGIAAIIGAIYSFVDGFFNAGDILDMEDSDLSIRDRIIAGFANVWGNVIKLFDWVLELFGFDLFDSEDIEKKIAKSAKKIVDGVVNWVGGVFNSIKDFITNFSITDMTETIKEKVKEFLKNMASFVPELMGKAFDQATGVVKDLGSNISSWWNDDDEEIEDAAKESVKGGGLLGGGGVSAMKANSIEFGAETSSSTMKSKMDNFEAASDKSDTRNNNGGSGGSAVVTGNGNTTVNQNSTQVTPVGNTSNLDDTLRSTDISMMWRLAR